MRVAATRDGRHLALFLALTHIHIITTAILSSSSPLFSLHTSSPSLLQAPLKDDSPSNFLYHTSLNDDHSTFHIPQPTMDASAYPHILDAIATASAANYVSGHDLTTALALRATSRGLRNTIDARLFTHVAWKDGQFLTPLLRRLPYLYTTPGYATWPISGHLAPTSSSSSSASTKTDHIRVLDLHSDIPKNFAFPRLETVRSAEACKTAPPALTLLKRVQETSICGYLYVPRGVRRCLFRWHPYPSIDNTKLRILPLRTTLEEVIVVFSHIDWRSVFEAYYLGAPLQRRSFRQRRTVALFRFVRAVLLPHLFALATHGVSVTFVLPSEYEQESDWPKDCRLVHDLLHYITAVTEYGYSGDKKGLADVVMSSEHQKFKDNAKGIIAAEWRGGASDLEIDWLERECVV